MTGVSSSEGPQIRSALADAALDMTTLHVREDALRAAVAQYPSVEGLDADANFPHKLTIEVRERAPVAAIESGGGTRRRLAATGASCAACALAGSRRCASAARPPASA